MKEQNIKDMKTSELMDKLHIELKKEECDDGLVGEIEGELDDRMPFQYIESRIEGDEGLIKQVEGLEKEIEELKRILRKHDHKDGKVVVRL